jgi:hypothetical protein
MKLNLRQTALTTKCQAQKRCDVLITINQLAINQMAIAVLLQPWQFILIRVFYPATTAVAETVTLTPLLLISRLFDADPQILRQKRAF